MVTQKIEAVSVTNEPEPQSKVSKAQKRRVGYNVKKCIAVVKKIQIIIIIIIKVEALVTGHPRDTKKVSVSGASCFQKCKNTEFVWEL